MKSPSHFLGDSGEGQSPRGICEGVRAGPRAASLVAPVQAVSKSCLTYLSGAVPPAVGLMADAILERNWELPDKSGDLQEQCGSLGGE